MKPSTRDRIVAGAVRVFSEKGISDVVVADVLLASDVSRRTFYKHFRSAEDVLRAVYESVTADLIQAVTGTIRDETDPLKQIVGAADAYLKHVVDNGQLIIALHAEAIRPGSALGPRREETLDAIEQGIDDAVAKALGKRIEPLVYRGLLTAVEGLVIHVRKEGAFTEDDRQRVLAVAGPIWINVLAGYENLPTRDDASAQSS